MSKSRMQLFFSAFRGAELGAESPSRNIQYKLKKDGGQTIDDKILDMLLADKQQRVVEMSEYNRRHDKMVTVYITGLYAALGIGVAGKLDLHIGEELAYVPLAFAFVFLNLCVLTHAISQSFWAMALAKYIHFVVDLRIRDLLFSKNGTAPSGIDKEESGKPFSYTWDDWDWEMKGCANKTRAAAIFLWVVLVHGVSITALASVDILKFCKGEYGVQVVLFSSLIIFTILSYAWASFYKLAELSGKFHTHPEKLRDESLLSIKSICVGLAVSVFVFTLAIKVIMARPEIQKVIGM